MAKEVNVPVEEQHAVVEQSANGIDVRNDVDFIDVFKALSEDANNISVKNAEIFSIRVGNRNKTYSLNDEEVNPADLFLTIKVNKKVRAYRADEDGEYMETIGNQFQIGYYSFLGTINNSESAVVRRMAAKIQRAVAANAFGVFEDFFVGATIDVVQQEVKEGETYVNPFSTNATEQEISHDMYITYIGNIRLDDSAIAGMNAARAKSFDW